MILIGVDTVVAVTGEEYQTYLNNNFDIQGYKRGVKKFKTYDGINCTILLGSGYFEGNLCPHLTEESEFVERMLVLALSV